MSTRIPFLASALVLSFLAACDSTGPGEVDRHYALQRINGQPLPVRYEDEVFLSEVTAGGITLYHDDRFVLESTTRETDKGSGEVESATDYLAGVYDQRGSALTLDFGRETLSGSVEGRTLEIRGHGEVWTFRR